LSRTIGVCQGRPAHVQVTADVSADQEYLAAGGEPRPADQVLIDGKPSGGQRAAIRVD